MTDSLVTFKDESEFHFTDIRCKYPSHDGTDEEWTVGRIYRSTFGNKSKCWFELSVDRVSTENVELILNKMKELENLRLDKP